MESGFTLPDQYCEYHRLKFSLGCDTALRYSVGCSECEFEEMVRGIPRHSEVLRLPAEMQAWAAEEFVRRYGRKPFMDWYAR